MSRIIRASQGEAKYISGVIGNAAGAVITGDTFEMSLGGQETAGSWVAPDVTQTVTASSVRVKVFVGSGGTLNPTPGVYYLWVRVTDSPEIPLLFIDERITLA